MGLGIAVAAVWIAVAAPLAVVVGRALARRRREVEHAISDSAESMDEGSTPEHLHR